MLSISFEVDVPTGKVGSSLLFKCRRRECPRGSGGRPPPPPRKFWNLHAWKCYFQCSPDSIWALRTIKIMLYKPYSMFITTVRFLKISITGFKCWFKKYIQRFKFMLAFWKNVLSNVCLGFFGADAILANAKAWGLVLWKCPRRSTTLRSHSICFNFLYFHWKVNMFKTPEMCLYLDSDVWAGWFTIIFVWSFHYFEPVSCRILVCENVTGIPRPFNQLPCTWER